MTHKQRVSHTVTPGRNGGSEDSLFLEERIIQNAFYHLIIFSVYNFSVTKRHYMKFSEIIPYT
jgi:hypothetical protein